MTVRFTPCPACDRHVKQGDCRCPFCGAHVPCAATRASRPFDARKPRSALVAAGVLGAAIAGTDCGGSTTSPGDGGSVGPDAASDAAQEAASHADASDTGTEMDSSGGFDATDEWPTGVALYGAPPVPEDAAGQGKVDPGTGQEG